MKKLRRCCELKKCPLPSDHATLSSLMAEGKVGEWSVYLATIEKISLSILSYCDGHVMGNSPFETAM
jgi:hypothetical protein